MGGKRPDQYAIDPSEGRATDHKTNPQSTHGSGGAGDDNTLRQGDKQRLQESQHGGSQPFLPDVPAPSAEAQRAASHASDHDDEEETGEEDSPA
jgi:hypothetical protein